MKLSVIIVNYNHKYFPRLAIEALEKNKPSFDFEIIVVDNNSTDEESLSFLEKAAIDKRIKLIKSPKNVGFGNGNNLGAQIASGEYIFIHNPDVSITEGSLDKMINYMDKHKDIGLLGPKLVYSDGKVQESCRRQMTFFDLVLKRTPLKKLPFFKKRVEHFLMSDFNHSEVQDVELVTGAAMVISKALFDKLGGFDKKYFLFMEDFDLCLRVHREHYRVVYFPEVALNHYNKRLSDGSLFKIIRKKVFWLHVVSAFKYFITWRGKTVQQIKNGK